MAHGKTVVALYARREEAERAISSLLESGIAPERIGYLEPVDERQLKDPGKGAAEGIAVGATSGAVIGGLLGAAIVSLIPGVGPALAAGALLPVVMASFTGAATGAVGGLLVGTDLASDEEPYFLQEVQAGRLLVSVEVEGEEEGVVALLRDSGALEVDRLGTATLHARLRHPQPDGGESAGGQAAS
jgi:hypothetical protein